MNKDALLITIVDECLQKARKMHIETMDEFSQWLANEEYILGHSSGTWRKSINNHLILMSELYQMFLKSKEV